MSLKLIITLIIFAIAFSCQFFLNFAYEDNLYAWIAIHKKSVFIFLYEFMVALVIAAVFNPYLFIKLKKMYAYRQNTKKWQLTHLKNNESFTSKLKRKMFDEGENKYLIKCFDGLHEMIINPLNADQRLTVWGPGGYPTINIRCSLINAIDNIANGVNFNQDIYLIFLKATASMSPRKVVGIWDLTVESGKIPDIDKLRKWEITTEYTNMYTQLKNDKVRFFIHDKEESDIKNFISSEVGSLMMFMHDKWDICKFYFIHKNDANGLLDGLIIDDHFYLSYLDKGIDSTVSFSTFPSNLKTKLEGLKTTHNNKMKQYTNFQVYH